LRGGADDKLLRAARACLADCDMRPGRDALRIELALAGVARGGTEATSASEELAAVREAAHRDGYHGLYWAATWAAARCAARQGDVVQARALLRTAMARPLEHVSADLWPGAWWHGLWQVGRAVGDTDAAQAARAEGVAWIHRLLQHELPAEFHPAFRDAVPAHRELLAAA
jgi:hypothetical protein